MKDFPTLSSTSTREFLTLQYRRVSHCKECLPGNEYGQSCGFSLRVRDIVYQTSIIVSLPRKDKEILLFPDVVSY